MINKIALTLIPEIGARTIIRLLEKFGSAKNIFSLKEADYRGCEMTIQQVRNLLSVSQRDAAFRRAEKELCFIEKNHIKTFVFGEKTYPALLKHCIDAPYILYGVGKMDFAAQKHFVSIVGTRHCTDYGRMMTKELVQLFPGTDTMIISGLAEGIDTASHQSAVQFGVPTVGVLGHGLDCLYPSKNRDLVISMIHGGGGVITEFLSGSRIAKGNFPQRNRIIAGMSEATIVIESKSTGGALITAELANDYNRDVYAVPGRMGDEASEGCNNLIKENKAAIVSNLIDFLSALRWKEFEVAVRYYTKEQNISPTKKKKEKVVKETEVAIEKPTPQLSLFEDCSEDERKVCTFLQQEGETNIDVMCRRLEIPPHIMQSLLFNLELTNKVISIPGQRWKLA